VMATLSVPADIVASREILRVENSQTDVRIEAAICRQFGAKSLIILLIYHNGAAAGVLEVFFSEAHAFQDSEVRTYLLMAGVIGEAMSHAAQLEQRKNLTVEVPTTPHATEQIIPQSEESLNEGGSVPVPANKRAIYQRCKAAMAVARELPLLRRPALLAAMILQRAQNVTLRKRQWNVALAAVAIMLVLTCSIVYSGRRLASLWGSSALPRSSAVGQQVPLQPAKATPAKGTFSVQPVPVPVEKARAARATLQRVRAGKNEVVYIGDDVTMRYFTPQLAQRRVRVGESQVVYIGDDVTVRHFTSK